jgi:hypothetical protein
MQLAGIARLLFRPLRKQNTKCRLGRRADGG